MDILTIECVSIATNHHFSDNPIAAQHRLRFNEVILKEQWQNIYVEYDKQGGVEFDRYDNLATEYLIARNPLGEVLGVTRTYPTTLPYMISDVFEHLVDQECLHCPQVHEAGRFVLYPPYFSKFSLKNISISEYTFSVSSLWLKI